MGGAMASPASRAAATASSASVRPRSMSAKKPSLRASAIKKLKGISPEVDNIAIGFLRFDPRCRFKPAMGKDGKPVPFVIERYVVTFENEN